MPVEVRHLLRSPSLLICCDLQNGHCQPGERRFMVDFEFTVSACGTLVKMWRGKGWPVAHLKRIFDSGWFPRSQPSLDWIRSVSPQPDELTFEHYLPSAYSSARYADDMRGMREMSCILAGFSLDGTHPLHGDRRVSSGPPLLRGLRCGRGASSAVRLVAGVSFCGDQHRSEFCGVALGGRHCRNWGKFKCGL